MPNIQYPHKTRPGYVAARRCTAPCGGWVVLLDRKAGGPEGLKESIKQTGRWILQHDPSGNWAGLDSKTDALLYLKAVAKGEDGEVGILPATVPPMKGAEDLDLQGTGGKGRSGARKRAAARVRATEASAREGEGGKAGLTPPAAAEDGKSPPGQEQGRGNAGAEADLPEALAFQRALSDTFGPDRIIEEITEGLKAEKSYVTAGSVVIVPDHQTRVKYLDLLLKYKIGTPDKREKPQEPKKISRGELESIIARSPAARKALKRMIADAEAAAVTVPPPGREEESK